MYSHHGFRCRTLEEGACGVVHPAFHEVIFRGVPDVKTDGGIQSDQLHDVRFAQGLARFFRRLQLHRLGQPGKIRGDGAQMAYLELIGSEYKPPSKDEGKKGKKGAKAEKSPKEAAAESSEKKEK